MTRVPRRTLELQLLCPRRLAANSEPLGISNRGNRYLRKNLMHGARAVLPHLAERDTPLGRCAKTLLAHKNKVVVTLPTSWRVSLGECCPMANKGSPNQETPRLRTTMIQLAWLWLRHQPDSQLSRWFQERVARKGVLIRKIMISALARKLLVAFWKYATAGGVIEGAAVKTPQVKLTYHVQSTIYWD
jgi:transposase